MCLSYFFMLCNISKIHENWGGTLVSLLVPQRKYSASRMTGEKKGEIKGVFIKS